MLWRKKKIVAESQFTNADDLTKEIKNYINNPDNGLKGYKLTLTGYSLGGGLSEYAGVGYIVVQMIPLFMRLLRKYRMVN